MTSISILVFTHQLFMQISQSNERVLCWILYEWQCSIRDNCHCCSSGKRKSSYSKV